MSLKSIGIGLLGLPWLRGQFGQFMIPSNVIFKEWIDQNDLTISVLITQQNQDINSADHGGFPDSYGIYHPISAAESLQRIVIGFIQEGSRYFQDRSLLVVLDYAVDFLLSKQHDDGTIDLLSTNFHSTPDLAFVVEPVALSLQCIQDHPELNDHPIKKKISEFLKLAGDALTVGGIHTPNHRWVVCRALARIHTFFPDSRYLDRIQSWLEEKIDIDPDGQYTERSTGVYTPLTDQCLITIAQLINREDLLGHVRRNLNMTLYLIHSNGDVVTEISRRQDQYRSSDLAPYFFSYYTMAVLDGNAVYAKVVDYIIETCSSRELSLNLVHFLKDSGFLGRLPSREEIPQSFFKHFKHSGLIRIKRLQYDASILKDNAAFFTFHKGPAILKAVRLASAFFGKGQFIPGEMSIKDGIISMNQRWEGPYFQPYPKDSIPGDGSWNKMPRENRPKSEIQHMSCKLVIREYGTGFQLKFDLTGTAHVPVALELAFEKGGQLSGVRKLSQTADTYVSQNGSIQFEKEGVAIKVDGVTTEHEWTQLRGAEPKIDADSVYVTGFTPFRATLEIY